MNSLIEILSYAFWIAIPQALLATLAFPLISFPIIVGLIFGIRQLVKQQPKFPRRFFLYIGIALIFQAVIALTGAYFYDTDYEWPTYIFLGLWVLMLGLSLFVIYKEKGRRIFMITISCFFLVWTFWTGLVSAMSVVNDWF
jgi:hypothetical protein